MYTHNSCWASHRTVDGFYFLVEGPDDQRFCERIIQPAIVTIFVRVASDSKARRLVSDKLYSKLTGFA